MARYRSPISSMRTRVRRPKDWYGGEGFATVAAAVTSVAWGILPSLIHPETDPTLMFSRFDLRVITSGAGAAGAEFAFGAIAFPYLSPNGIASDAVPAAAAVPDPATDMGADWIYWKDFLYLPGDAAGTQSDISLGPWQNMSSKARRRLGNNQSVLIVTHAIGVGVSYHWHGRFLLAE